MVERFLTEELLRSLQNFPVTAILGARQSGKSTLAKMLMETFEQPVYLDLERPSDLQKLEDAEWFLSSQQHRLVCIDEVQRKPDLFPVIRSLVDENRRNGRFLVLGSASRDLIRQSSETLAGRIVYKKLTPFLWSEVRDRIPLEYYLSRGGFPLSVLAENDRMSMEWRESFITTFLERDLLQFAGFSPLSMRRLWQMLAHTNGQTLNASSLGSSLGISHTSVRNYIDLLEGTFMVRQLRPWMGNTKKRLIKSPKVYLTDTGITTALLNVSSFEQAAGHPVFGSLWELTVLENIAGHYPGLELSFYRTSHGTEIDLVVSDRINHIAVECKATLSPSLSKGNYSSIEDIAPVKTLVVIPSDEGYTLKKGIDVVSLSGLIDLLPNLLRVAK